MKKHILLIFAIFIFSAPLFASGKFDFDNFTDGVKQKNLSVVYATGLRTAKTSKYDAVGVKYRETKFTSSTDESGYEILFGDVLNSPNNNAVIATFTYSKYFIVEKESAVSIDLGIGFSYFFKGVYEQGSKFNFIENLGLSYHYSLDKSSALTLGFKINHISNAGIFPPNRGINALSLSLGYTWIIP